MAQLSQLLVEAAAGDEGLDVEAVALSSVQPRQHYPVGLRGVFFLQMTQEGDVEFGSSYSHVLEDDVAMSAATHPASAPIFPIDDFILQLVGEDVPDVQLAAVFKQGGERVDHM